MTNDVTTSKTIRGRAWAVSLLAILGIYLSALSNHNIAYVVFVFIIGCFLFMTTEEMYTVSFFLLPFSMIFKASPTGSSLFTYLVIIVACIVVLKTRKIRVDVCVLVLLLAAYLLFGIGDGITTYLKLLFNVFFFYGFITNVHQEGFRKIVLALSIGMIISSFIGLQKQTDSSIASFFDVVKTEYINGVEIVRFSGLYLDPNYFSILVIVCLFGLTVYMLKKEVPTIQGLVIDVALCIFGCLTLSKIFYITLAIGVVFLLGIYAKTSRNIGKVLFVAVAIVGIAYYFADISGIIDQIIFRFNADDISNNRLNIWSDYFSYIRENVSVMIFGAGINAEAIGGSGAHSFYIELAYYLGFFGSLLYIFLYSILLFSKPMVNKRTFGNYSLLVIIMVMYATLGILFMNDFVFVLLVVWMMLNTEMQHRKSIMVVDESEEKCFEKIFATSTSN